MVCDSDAPISDAPGDDTPEDVMTKPDATPKKDSTSDDQKIKDLPDKRPRDTTGSQVKGGIGPIDGKKPPVGPIDA